MLTRIDKAIVAGIGAASAFAAALGYSGKLSDADPMVLIAVVGAGVIVGVVTFAVPNKT